MLYVCVFVCEHCILSICSMQCIGNVCLALQFATMCGGVARQRVMGWIGRGGGNVQDQRRRQRLARCGGKSSLKDNTICSATGSLVRVYRVQFACI